MKWSMLRDLSVHNTSLTCCLDKSEWERVSRFPVIRSRSRKPQSELSFLFPLPPTTQLDVVHQHVDLRHKPPTSSFVGFFLLSFFLLPRVHSYSVFPKGHFPFRHLHVIPQLVRCHHQLASHLDSELSLDLRAHCSATLVSRLLSVVHIVGLCGFHFSVQVKIEKNVFEINWNEFVLSIRVHQFLKISSHSLTNLAVNRNHVTTVMSHMDFLSSFARATPCVLQ